MSNKDEAYKAYLKDFRNKQYEEYLKSFHKEASPDVEGGTPEKAIPTDIYGGDDVARLKASFGNVPGLLSHFKKIDPRVSEVTRNQGGDLSVKIDGKWYRDQDQFTKHPLNWLESAMGKAPSTLGMVAGAMGGEALPLPGAAYAGAAGGSMAGEAARQAIGRYLGVHQGTDAKEIAAEGANGLLGEVGGKFLGATARSFAGPQIDAAGRAIGKHIAGASSLVSGVDKAASERLWERPRQVNNPPSTFEVAQKMTPEIRATGRRRTQEMRAAQDEFNQGPANYSTSTADIIDANRAEIKRAQEGLNAHGEGAYTPEEIAQMQELEKSLITKRMSESPELLPGSLGNRAVFGAPTVISPAQVIPPVEATAVRPAMGLENRLVPDRRVKNPIVVTPGKTIPAVTEPNLLGFENSMPDQTLGSLVSTAKARGREVGRVYDKTGTPIDRTSPYLNRVKAFTHDTKKTVYDAIRDPETGTSPYEIASNAFSRHQGDNSLLKPALGEKGREGLVNRLVKGESESELMSAGQRAAPNAMQDILDMRADQAFKNSSPRVVGPITQRHVLEGLVGLGGAGISQATGGDKLDQFGAGALAASLFSPRMHRFGLRWGSTLLPPLTRQVPAAAIKGSLDAWSPWTLGLETEPKNKKEGGQ